MHVSCRPASISTPRTPLIADLHSQGLTSSELQGEIELPMLKILSYGRLLATPHPKYQPAPQLPSSLSALAYASLASSLAPHGSWCDILQ